MPRKIPESVFKLKKFEKQQEFYSKALKAQRKASTVIKSPKSPKLNPMEQSLRDDQFDALIRKIKEVENEYKSSTITRPKIDKFLDDLHKQPITVETMRGLDSQGIVIQSLAFEPNNMDYNQLFAILVTGRTKEGHRLTKFLVSPKKAKKS